MPILVLGKNCVIQIHVSRTVQMTQLTQLAALATSRVKVMFSKVAYRPIVYKTGIGRERRPRGLQKQTYWPRYIGIEHEDYQLRIACSIYI